MFLAFNPADIITVPFGYLLSWLYQLTTNYGLALIIFAVIVQLVLLPITAKSKKSMMKMSRLTPKNQAIKEKYANEQQKLNEAIQKLQQEEGATMGCGGCLWSFVPMLILLPLYQVVRQPLVYLLHVDVDTANQIIEIIKAADGTLFGSNNYYDQIVAASNIAQHAAAIKEAIPAISEAALEGINFGFLQIDLGTIPNFNVFAWTAFSWANIGAFLIPVISAGSQVLQMFISRKMNNSVVTDKNGLQDKETAAKSQADQSSKMMMWMMPIMSLWIGFTVPAALSLYWFVGGVVRTVEDMILTKHYRKIYDAEDAERLKRHLEEEALEAEKERIRAEKRAANPDGITENTSKKKLQKKQQAAEEAAKAAAKREYDAKKGIVDEDAPEKEVMSGISSRPYCKGRNYDPNRYGHDSTEE